MGRRTAETLMRDTCTITRPGEQVWDAPSQDYIPGPEVQVYTGRCKLRMGGTQSLGDKAGDQRFIEQQEILSLPIDTSTGVVKDDKVVITASEDDPGIVGTTVWIDARPQRTLATARRFPVRETQ
jgi:hypothetical protein